MAKNMVKPVYFKGVKFSGYSNWHRQQHNCLGFSDIDQVSTCNACLEPLFLAETPTMSITDAIFESMSGLTTTGATVLTGLDTLPKSILYYRQQLQWFGGMGIIVLAVAVLPMLGVGGMQLYRAEAPGPVKDTRLTPRITETAKALWYVYLTFTIACIVCYMLAGMEWFDALCHAFSTVAIGGFSPHDLSIGYFDSTAIELVAIFFMFAAGINFSLHFFALRHTQIKHYASDSEFPCRPRLASCPRRLSLLPACLRPRSRRYSALRR